MTQIIKFRGSHRSCSIKKGALKNFAKFTGKTCARVSLLINFIKKETLVQVFSCKFCENFKNTFFTEPLGWLFLKVMRGYTLRIIVFVFPKNT